MIYSTIKLLSENTENPFFVLFIWYIKVEVNWQIIDFSLIAFQKKLHLV